MYSQIKEGLRKQLSTLALRDIIVGFKADGGSQQEAMQTLEKLRLEFSQDEAKGDKLLELLDFVSGWCSDEMRI